MLCVSNLLCKISALIKLADAKRNLEKYLGAYLRPEFIKHEEYRDAIDIGSIFNSMEIKTFFDKEEVLQDLVDRFITRKKAEDVRALMKAHSTKFGEEARTLIGYTKTLTAEQEEIVKKMVKDLVPLAYKYIRTDFEQGYKEWLRKHEKESPMDDLRIKLPELSVPPEHEVEEDAKKSQEWEQGLIKDTLHLINKKFPKDHHVMKIILKDMFLAKTPKSQKQVAEELHMDEATLMRRKKELQTSLKEFYTAQGLGGKFLEEGGLVKKEIEIPKYTEYLKNSENSKELKEFIEDKISSRLVEKSVKAINLLAEGDTLKEVASKINEPEVNIRLVKSTYFDKWYKEWYEDKIEDIRKAYIEESIMATACIPYEIVESKETEEDEDQETEAGALHKKMIERAFRTGRVIVTIEFHSEYDNLEVLSGKKDPTKDQAHFRFQSYTAKIEEERMAGKSERSVEYVYHQKLNDDGTFIGRGDSILKLDGDPTKDGLKQEIDKYIEEKVKPEGMFPHAHFATSYKNSKGGKIYRGVHGFIKYFRGILTWDLVHKQRMESWTQLQLKKDIGHGVSETKEEDMKESLILIREKIKKEEAKRDELKNHEEIIKLKKEEKELQEALRGENVLQDEIDEILKREHEHQESTKLAVSPPSLPPPQHENIKKLLEIFKDYKVDSPNPKLWLEPKDLTVLARVLKSSSDNTMDMEIKKLKEEKNLKQDTRNQKMHEISDKHNDNLSKAIVYFKDIPKDLKTRAEMMEKKNPKEYAEYAKKKDLTWVDNKDKIENVMSRVRKELFEKRPVEDTKKDRGVKILEKSKYKTLEAYLLEELEGIDKIGQILEHASLNPSNLDTELKSKINAEISHSESELKKMHGILEDMSKAEAKDSDISEEETKKIEEARDGIQTLSRYIKSMREQLSENKDQIPALNVAKVLQSKMDYFSGLYSKLSGILWFRDKPLLRSSAELPEVETANLEKLRNKTVREITIMAAINIFQRDSLKSGMATVNALLKKFVSAFSHKKEASMPYSLVLNDQNSLYYRQASELDNARIKSIFPADELFHAEHLINKTMGESKKKDIRTLAPIAREELDKILKNVSEAYKNAFTPDKIKAIAKRENMSFEQASVRLKRIEDSLAKAAIGGFLLKWEDFFDKRNIPKDRSDLGNRPGKEYEKMGEYVERHLPDLFKLTPTEEVPKEPARGIPTPTKIRELLEEQFSPKKPDLSKETEKDVANIFFDSDYFHGGGGGGSSKGRKKPAKNPPVSGMHEIMKDTFLRLYNSKSPKDIVAYYMAVYTVKMKHFIQDLKDDEYVDADSIIDSYISMLKNVYHMILSLKVEPSATAFKQPPAGAPMFSGKPDIPIDNSKEAEQVFNKLVEIYKAINQYLDPDTVGVPPKSLENLTKVKKYLPNYLADWYSHFKKKEQGPATEKKATGVPMSFRIMGKFAGTGIQEVEKLTDLDSPKELS